MAKGDSTGASAVPQNGAATPNQAIQQQLGMYPAGQGGQMQGGIGYGGGGMNNMMRGMGQMGSQMGGGQQNPLFQNMDPRLVQLFQKYNVNPTGQGTGNSDIAYWNGKMGAQGADQNYFLNRLEQDFQGTGMDLGNNNLSYGGGQGNLAGRYYQQPMQRPGLNRSMAGGNNRFPTQPRMGMGGQRQPQRFGGYTNQPSGLTPPTFNPSVTPRPTPAPDTSEHPK
jgi:hypothetical protein